jgi:hypothetical protein
MDLMPLPPSSPTGALSGAAASTGGGGGVGGGVGGRSIGFGGGGVEVAGMLPPLPPRPALPPPPERPPVPPAPASPRSTAGAAPAPRPLFEKSHPETKSPNPNPSTPSRPTRNCFITTPCSAAAPIPTLHEAPAPERNGPPRDPLSRIAEIGIRERRHCKLARPGLQQRPNVSVKQSSRFRRPVSDPTARSRARTLPIERGRGRAAPRCRSARAGLLTVVPPTRCSEATNGSRVSLIAF